ncbi:MAG: N-acetylmuramoyl-L-alanine amidase, partial [Oscillospiraceae bacterium]|nr:N-acetylmuramoyl-L-alanine amidase [Oscillospiraceae bacterium]
MRTENAVPLVLALVAIIMVVSIYITLNHAETLFASVRPYSHTVVIDAGHGGEDGGAVSVNGIHESGINLAIAQKTDALMRFYGVRTVMVRTDDISIHHASARTIAEKKRSDLVNRVELINGVENALLLSIHQNSFPESKYFGAQMFHGDDPAAIPLALRLQELFLKIDPDNTRKIKKVTKGAAYVMDNAECPAILAECGFLSNHGDAGKLTAEPYQRKVAAVLLAGYLDSIKAP